MRRAGDAGGYAPVQCARKASVPGVPGVQGEWEGERGKMTLLAGFAVAIVGLIAHRFVGGWAIPAICAVLGAAACVCHVVQSARQAR